MFFLVWQSGSTWRRWALIALSYGLSIAHALGELPELNQHYQTVMNPLTVVSLITLFYALLAAVSLRRTGTIGGMTWPLAGALTYPLYLLHQNIGYIVFHQLHGKVNDHVLMWGTAMAMIALAYVIHQGVEKPLAPHLKHGVDGLLGRVPPSLLPKR
jgi:peptidoglycan/LPS O-acetylase OafA/YrhL